MENCKHCQPLANKFSTIGKTYYIVQERRNKSIMCYRHWYQAGKPEYIMSGDYIDIVQSLRPFKPKKKTTN